MSEKNESILAEPLLSPLSSSPKPPPSLETIQSWLPLYLQKADTNLTTLSRLLSTPSGTDKLLMTICYTTLLTSSLFSTISLARLRRTAQILVDKAVALPPNTTLLIDPSAIPSSKLLITATRLKALSTLISDFRIFARLFGLVGIYHWGKSVLTTREDDGVLRGISYAQVLVNTCFQALENGAYLSSKGVMSWSPEKQNKAWLWSCRFWVAHVGLDFWRLYHEYQVRRSKVEAAEDKDDGTWLANWRKEMFVNAGFAPLTLHWSLEKGLLGDFGVGLCGSVAAISGLRVLWKDAKIDRR